MEFENPLVNVNKLVIADRRRPFGNRRWRIVFTSNPEYFAGLTRVSRAILFTFLVEGLEQDGLIVLHRASLSGLYSRPSLAEALRELEERGVIRREGDLLYLNPTVGYAGPASQFEKTMAMWWRQSEMEGKHQ